jgi:surface polysaccharide O-acyltransferase-like enzyme
MKRYRAELWLLAIFLIFFVLQTALLVVCQLLNGVGADKLKDLVVQLITIYSVPLSVIIAGTFAKRRRAAKLDGIFYASVVLAVLWNSLFAWRTVELTLAAIGVGEDRVKYFSEYLESVSKVSTFLISGLLTYYFAKAPEGSGAHSES